ncbi:MAG: hypothetical protein ABIQ39_02390, partial [Ilumatobacteraceae bacterium]
MATDAVTDLVTGTRRVWVSDTTSGLGVRVLRRVGDNPTFQVGELSDCEVLIWLTASNAEARARRKQSATEGLAAALVTAGAARHVVLVSSAMVYG